MPNPMSPPLSRTLVKACTQTTVPKRFFSVSRSNKSDFTHAVIGGGAVGLAIARQLAKRSGTSTVLIEQHGTAGTETSSRNSEVIHAGLYYGPDSLKTQLCIRGKHLLYELAEKHQIPFRATKKWVLAQDAQQMEQLDLLHKFSKTIDVPTQFLTREQIATQEDDVRAEGGVLESPTTGIIDSHAYMTYLEGDLQELEGEVIYNTRVTGLEAIGPGGGDSGDGKHGYRISTRTRDQSNQSDGDDVSITVDTVINSGGLGAISISNMLLPPERHRTPFYAKGTYFSYAASHPKPQTLLYPAPVPGLGGLGTHLTLDMAGRVRFGPDVEWVDDPTDLSPSPARLDAAVEMIRSYLPGIQRDAIDLDYCGIRPKLSKGSSGTFGKDGTGFEDFYIVHEDGFQGFVNLLGIESPGLTASLAIAEKVDAMLYG
ncbi:hypothetical protein PV10_01653 [Exophiala mesophila]|uniref:L-2-hydroxyglutarate dehydrogenase, mitochondrial n=1 Tax=Exophiala mesophila TaxID=212818 RepID=A0A0D2AGC2_EXOME|nr:uncharacterized protein PV10_01653 [Exophiala mesophila]KIV97958.1 hypothetical protein PV10_01653 [Exophiala mesophila]